MTTTHPPTPRYVTFDELVEYGRANGANIVNGMPWSFTFNGVPITHENDECYLVNTFAGTQRFTPRDVMQVGPLGQLVVFYAVPAAVARRSPEGTEREHQQVQGWTKKDQPQEPVLQRFTSVAQREAYERLRSRINVSKAIIARRMELDMTQAEIAARAGTKQSRISEMEQLAGNVRFDTLERVAEALGLMVTLVPRNDASRVDSVPAVDPSRSTPAQSTSAASPIGAPDHG